MRVEAGSPDEGGWGVADGPEPSERLNRGLCESCVCALGGGRGTAGGGEVLSEFNSSLACAT